MTVFPFRRPHLGLSIGAGMLGLAEVRRDWRQGRGRLKLHRSGDRALPPGLIRPSATEPNMKDVTALTDELCALLGGRRQASRALSVALTLPDLCARVALLDFESLPQKPAERETLLRWRFQRDLNLAGTDVRVAYRVFQEAAEPRAHPDRREPGSFWVLACAIRQDIVGQYEQACEEAGLLPISVGLAGLRLFDLCRPALAAGEEFFFVHVADSGFSFLGVRHGSPVFLRIKPLRNGSATLATELLATLQFYTDRHRQAARADPTAPEAARPLFIVGDPGLPGSFAESLGITVLPLGLDDLSVSKTLAAGALSSSSLPALAGVLDA